MTPKETMVDEVRMMRLLARHRFKASSDPQLGFCGGPYCATGLVRVVDHEAHLVELIAEEVGRG